MAATDGAAPDMPDNSLALAEELPLMSTRNWPSA
jgi:hypothetical protein